MFTYLPTQKHTFNVFETFVISNFRRVLYVVCFHLGNSLASEFYMPTFRNALSVPSSYAGTGTLCLFNLHRQVPAYEDGTVRVLRNFGI
jgi:hypothetical protein